MSVAQTYHLAHKARAKLCREAARPAHNLRRLVGHANLLDNLMLDLADAERQQESWFNQSTTRASSPAEQTPNQHIKWSDTVVVEAPTEDEDYSSSESDSDEDGLYADSDSDSSSEEYYDEDGDVDIWATAPLTRVASHSSTTVVAVAAKPITPSTAEYDDDAESELDDDLEDYPELALSRTQSHPPTSHLPLSSPPDLTVDDDYSSSDDEPTMPPSPTNVVQHEFSDKEREAMVTTGYYQHHPEQKEGSPLYDQGFYLPTRNPGRLAVC